MHVLAFREDLGETFPGLPKALMAMWGDDRSQADKAYAEYDFTMMPFGRFAFSGAKTSSARSRGSLDLKPIAATSGDISVIWRTSRFYHREFRRRICSTRPFAILKARLQTRE